jgi:hypothetical protein
VNIGIKERGTNRHLEKTSSEEFQNDILHKIFFGLAQLA